MQSSSVSTSVGPSVDTPISSSLASAHRSHSEGYVSHNHYTSANSIPTHPPPLPTSEGTPVKRDKYPGPSHSLTHPIPASLLPGFHSPSLAHANRDLAFTEPISSPRPPFPRTWTNPPSNGRTLLPYKPPAPPPLPSGFRTFQRPVTPSCSSVATGSSHSPIVPPRPTTSYIPNTSDTWALNEKQSPLRNLPSTPESQDESPESRPIVPPRPNSTVNEVFRHSSLSSLSRQPADSSSPPTLPPPPVPPLPAGIFDSTVTTTPSDTHSSEHHNSPPFPPVVTPPLPPKPSTLETNISDVEKSESPQSPGSVDPKHALTLSVSDKSRTPSVNNIQEEDNDLALALAESLAFSVLLEDNATSPPRQSLPRSEDTSQTQPDPAVPESLFLEEEQTHIFEESEWAERYKTSSPERKLSITDFNTGGVISPEDSMDDAANDKLIQAIEDEEMTRMLQEEESAQLAIEMGELEKQDEDRVKKDEEMTKRLQEEEYQRMMAEDRERELEQKRLEAEVFKHLQEEMEAESLEAERRERGERERLDAELARREAAEERSQKLIREAQERKDEEVARRLAEEMSKAEDMKPKPAVPPKPSMQVPPDLPPQYGHPPLPVNGTGTFSPQRVQAQPGQAAPSYSGDAQEVSRVNRGRVGSAIAVATSSRLEHSDIVRASSLNAIPARTANGHLDTNGTPPHSRGPSPGSSSIEPDLLNGVSYGFNQPDIKRAPVQSGTLTPCPPFPDVIQLSRAPTKPFHIMAPSWRHLMRLLAQLETRIQAHLDVIAHSKEDNHLRVVVQFTKLPYTANTWRTVLYLSLDEPIPRNTPAGWRFTNGDTTVLPYSYSLGEPTPHLTNSGLSQIYVIPLSATSPFPILPLALPNLALYLQSAMRDSRARKVQNDPSNGMRRLARILTACYPEEIMAPEKEDKRPTRGVGGLLKRVVGRGTPDREESQGNEDVYDIITPFRIDQYTTS